MAILHEIQAALISNEVEIGPVLMKLRLLAARLGSVALEDWVKHESEGYPEGVELPEYRTISVSHTGTWNGPFGGGVRNAPIPPQLIAHFAGADWLKLPLRQSVASIDQLIASSKDDGVVRLDRSALVLKLNHKVYPDFECASVVGHVSKSALAELKNAVQTRILELTIALERNVPEAAQIELGPVRITPTSEGVKQVTNITNQVIHGNWTNVTNSGAGAKIEIAVRQGDQADVISELTRAGIPDLEARKFAEVLESEKPAGSEPFGPRAAQWVADNIGKAASGAWKMGVSAATTVLSEAAKRYYGL